MFKPYQLVKVNRGKYAHLGQVISYPTPDGTIMVRMVPGDPSTMEEVPVGKLSKSTGYKWVHYARARGWGKFPIDMLRYDFAAPVNFTLREDEYDGQVIEPKDDSGDLIIARCTDTKNRVWTDARWQSFGWSVEPIRTLRIGKDTD